MPTTYAVPNGRTVFSATTYTGNGATNPSSQAITNSGFQPDFVWIKSRSNAYPNFVWDVIRGLTNNPYLQTDDTAAQASDATGNQLSSFNSNGFSVQNTTGGSVGTNGSGSTFVGWNWKANGTGVSNTVGSISSTVSANTTAGFSVVRYTGNGSSGSTVGHGLGAVPAMVIIKSTTNGSADWQVFHKMMNSGSSPWNYSIYLNSNGGQSSYTGFNNTTPTSTVFTLGSNGGVNQSSGTFIAYCWSEVDGYSKFGYYTGNGSDNGPFIYTGFKPAFTMIKCISTSGEWTIHDNKRPGYNQSSQYLFADVTDAEYNNVYNNIDYLSNGFKCRGTTGTNQNGNGYTYIYMAFAENPFKYANAG